MNSLSGEPSRDTPFVLTTRVAGPTPAHVTGTRRRPIRGDGKRYGHVRRVVRMNKVR